MPSDPRATRALQLLATPIERYRTALATTLEEIRAQLDLSRSDADGRRRRLRDQLGAFGARIDTARLAGAMVGAAETDPADLTRLEHASDTLRNLASRGDSLFDLEVPAGTDVALAVRRQLASIGRGFAAARIASAARLGTASGIDETRALDAFPFAEWTAAERRLAPPMVVRAAGTDLVAGALAPLLDGSMRLLLILEGFCPPAPLVRLITPGTLVIQAHELADLQPLATAKGPAVGALVPLWAAAFTHDPAAGSEYWQRLSVHQAREWRIKRVGPFSPEQQQEELAQLEALATAPAATRVAPLSSGLAPVPNEPLPATKPEASSEDARQADVDRLAAWLLQHAGLSATE